MSSRAKPLPPPERVRELLDYDPDTGVFTWRVRRAGTAKAGARAGGIVSSTGYRALRIDGATRSEHRIAWLLERGPIPPGMEVDHINGDPTDNRIANLRLASREENCRNARLWRRSSAGLKGVRPRSSGRFQARIMVSGKHIHLGDFDTAEEAHAAYCEAARRLHGAFHNPGTNNGKS